MDNYNYPWGADTPDAPWNQVEVPERDFDVIISQTLSKSTTVTTSNYIPVSEREEDFNNFYCDTSNTNWKDAYSESGHYTPLELIEKFKELLEKYMPDPIVNMKDYKKARFLIEECKNWIEDDIEIMEE